ncbi:pseudouridine synthase [Ferrovibrio sp.]|uniref:pseudouridine synthase n=1 Tax=Ferrovibrio sp. TaxID=1917215 RepID=UPI00351699CA
MTDETAPGEKGERIAKRLARAGICSRRDAERWIEEGRVSVNGKKLATPAFLVGPGDRIVVDGKPVAAAEKTRLWLYHKPRGLMTTHRDPEGRPTVFEKLPKEMPRVISVGRLDYNSEGLLLLTNDGALARKLELPATGWLRRYRVRVYGHPTDETLAVLQKGVSVDGVAYGPIHASVEKAQGDNTWLVVSLREGKNREVRRVMEHLGHQVSRLIRVAYGPFQLGTLPPEGVKEIPGKIVAEQTGDAITAGRTGARPKKPGGWAKAAPKPKRGQKPAARKK